MALTFVSAFELGEINGTRVFTGTGLGVPATDGDIKISDFNDEFFYGQIANIGNTDARVTLVFAGEGVGFVTHQLRRKEVMTIEGIPLRSRLKISVSPKRERAGRGTASGDLQTASCGSPPVV